MLPRVVLRIALNNLNAINPISNSQPRGRGASYFWETMSWNAARGAIGVVLLTAAVLKSRADALTPRSLSVDLAHGHLLVFSLVVVETVIGAALLAGIGGRALLRACTAVLVMFGMVAAAKAIGGAASCGCFGTVTVAPWLTAIFDFS